jgi:hypothetical protein
MTDVQFEADARSNTRHSTFDFCNNVHIPAGGRGPLLYNVYVYVIQLGTLTAVAKSVQAQSFLSRIRIITGCVRILIFTAIHHES